MPIRERVLHKHGFFGTFWQLLLAYIVTLFVFYSVSYLVLYLALGHLPRWWLPLITLAPGAACYRSIVGIRKEFFTKYSR